MKSFDAPAHPQSGGHLHTIIVGGGVIGLSVAHHLADITDPEGIAIIDAPGRPGVASAAAAGMLVPHAEFDSDSALYRLCIDSYDYYEEFLHRYAPQMLNELHTLDVYVPCSEDEEDRAERIGSFASKHTKLRREAISAMAAQSPVLQGGALREALVFPGRLINPRKLQSALVESAVKRGIHLVRAEAERLHRDTTGVSSVHLRSGLIIEAETFVIASGAWSAPFANDLGLSLNVIPVKGQMARIDTPEGALNAIVHHRSIYLAPRRGEGIIIGATVEPDDFNPAVDKAAIDRLFANACHFAPGLRHYPIVETWSGFRPRLSTEEPMINWSPRHRNLLLAVGHYRNGILLTPITGKKVCEVFRERALVALGRKKEPEGTSAETY